MTMETLTGVIIKAQSGFFTVHTAQGDVVCHLRGRLKQHQRSADLAALGDSVEISRQPDGRGMIEAVAERRSALMRRVTGGYGRGAQRNIASHTAQVIIANADQVVLVFACANPTPNPRLIDRFLVVVEATGLPALICANKRDLVDTDQFDDGFALYPPLNYHVLATSAHTGLGLPELRAALAGKISVFTGPSGVGKSTLLNALQPGLALPERAVSNYTGKGRHTTVHPELMPLAEGGYVADTPGIRTIAPWDVEPEELDGYFVDIRQYVTYCAFSDCTHLHEPGCAVREAVANGKIAAARYDSYCRMRQSETESLSPDF